MPHISRRQRKLERRQSINDSRFQRCARYFRTRYMTPSMSQLPPVTISPSEQNATTIPAPARSDPSVPAPAPTPALTPGPKRRSCAVCRARKVRCDKLSPCSNCRRGNIACILPSSDRPPRWARQLERAPSNAASNAPARVMDRVRELESLVKELSGQLERLNGAARSSAGGSTGPGSPESSRQDGDTGYQVDTSPQTNTGNVQSLFGRLVLQDANRSRYVSSGFWSRVDDELDGLDSDSSEDETLPTTQEIQRTPSERHAFLFRHNLSPSGPDLREFHPLPSQIPFLLDVFSENVNSIIRIVHIPTITKMVRDLRRSDKADLTPANEALMFSIYYAAVTSMEEDDIMANFGLTKTELNLKYRLGLEHALAKADFLNVPDLVLVQAFTIFLMLVRRHDSPRFVWMMMALLVRMAHALGLHRDGNHFKHLTPYEIEMRRRVWWALCMMDMRAAEDQGMDYSIASGSFDTKLPLSINDADIGPETAKMPEGREGITDMTFSLVWFELGDVAKQMMANSTKEGPPNMEEQNRLLDEIYIKLDRGYLRYSTESDNIAYWVAVIIARLMMAKMTLLIYLPLLFSSPSEHFSKKVQTKLLIAAIENAEYNHALNAEEACRHWRWVYQTYTHWYAIVYLLIEISRREWSPLVERAWVALHSQWLIPSQSNVDKNSRIWVPLRKLIAKARKHRYAELERLRRDPQAAERLAMEDEIIPIPASPGPFPTGSNVVQLFRERWRQLLSMPEAPGQSGSGVTNPTNHSTLVKQPRMNPVPPYSVSDSGSITISEPAYLGADRFQTIQSLQSDTSSDFQSAMTANVPSDFAIGNMGSPYNAPSAVPTTWSMGPEFVPWLWADGDLSVDVFANMDVDAINVDMDLDGEVNWYNWVESAKGII